MKLRFDSKGRLAALALITAGLILPDLTIQPANAAPATGTKKTAGSKHKPGTGRRGQRAGRMQRMKAELNLTDAQIAKMKPIFKAGAEQRRAIMTDKSLTLEQKKSRMRRIRTDQMNKLKAILTPAQQNKMKQTAKERRKHRAAKKAKA